MEKNSWITKLISDDEYFMNIAECVAMKSNDPHTHVGAVIVKDNKIISTGYNELCCYLEKSSFSSSRVGLGKTEDEKWLNSKYPYIVHAEMNALINCSNKSDLSGAKLFVTLFPCNECAKNLLQAGIVEIIYKDNLYPNNKLFIASKKIFDSVKKIKVRKVKK